MFICTGVSALQKASYIYMSERKIPLPEKFIPWCHIYHWCLFWQMRSKHCTPMKEVCGLQRCLRWKINIIWSPSMEVFWSAYEFFNRTSYIYIYIYIYILQKTPRNPGSLFTFHELYIYIYIYILCNSSILDIERSPYYIALGSSHNHKVILWQLTLL